MDYIGTLKGYIASGCKFIHLGSNRNAIRVYNRHGVTIQTIDLDEAGEDMEAEIFDLLTPYL